MILHNNKILIIGGATGIGLGLCERFIEEGNTVIICSRNAANLSAVQTKYPSVITKVVDVSIATDRQTLFEWIQIEHPDLNVLVNNAGIQNWMDINDEQFLSKAQQEIAVNIEAPIHLAHLFIQLPKLNTIMNVTSGLSFVPLAKAAIYSATKAFFHSFTLSLRHMLKSRNIEVVEIIPPALNNDLGGKGLHDYAPPVSEFIVSIFEQLKSGKDDLTFENSIALSQAGPDAVKMIFSKMNA
jgi:uncharacterized oxidoreductase